MGLVVLLQVGNAIAGQSTYQALQNASAACVATFFDSVTQVETDPDAASVTMTLVKPDTSTLALTVTKVAQGIYSAVAPLALVGTYALVAQGTQAGAPYKSQAMAVTVAAYVAPNSVQAVQWIPITSVQSPYTALVGSPNVSVDLRAGAVTVKFWATPSDGDIITVKDEFNLASGGSGPIQLQGNGQNLENPSSPGTYAATGTIASAAGFVGTWEYSLLRGAWLLRSH